MVDEHESAGLSTLGVNNQVIKEIKLPVMTHLDHDRLIQTFLERVHIHSEYYVRDEVIVYIVYNE